MQDFSPVLSRNAEDNSLSPCLGGSRAPVCHHCDGEGMCDCRPEDLQCACCKAESVLYLGYCPACEYTHGCTKCGSVSCCTRCAGEYIATLMAYVPTPTSPEVCYECTHPHECYTCGRTYSTQVGANACCEY